jgi:serine/threonine-protein phosphatase 2A regulatory subunit B''
MPTFPYIQSLQETFYPFYVITAVHKFFFFLYPKRTGKIQIKDMLTSPILAELYDLRQEQLNMDNALQNWFSLQSSLRVYNQYLKLDQEKNGILKKHELSNLSKSLTKIFIERIFEEYQTFEGEID